MGGELIEQHGRILAAAEAFLVALHCEPRVEMVEINRMRVKLAGLVRQHVVTEEAKIHEPLRQPGGMDGLTHLEPLIQQIMVEKLKYSEHVRQWTPDAIQADWRGYVAAVTDRIDALRFVMREEEEKLYPPVLKQVARRAAA